MAHGGRREGAGRKKGSVDQSTIRAREAIQNFTEMNADKLMVWMEQIAAESPKDAMDCYLKVLEYNLPKLSRAEVRHEGEVSISALLADLGDPEK